MTVRCYLRDKLLNTGMGCWTTLLIVGGCLGVIFILIFEPLGWVIWGATAILAAFTFPILFVFDFYDELRKKNLI
jgi:hypothetical protein